MQLIPQWRNWHKRWSTWLLSGIPLMTAARDFVPQIHDLIDPEAYKLILVFLSVAVFVALQIKQRSVSGDTPPNDSGAKP